MNNSVSEFGIIGRVKKCDFPLIGANNVPCKVDTGADLSSIWASDIKISSGVLSCRFFGKGSPFYDRKIHKFSNNSYTLTRVSSSFGEKELRYKVKLKIRIDNRLINATFTLADRGNKLYPVLLGRRLLRNKFVVDVAQGTPLKEAEKLRKQKLKSDLRKLKGASS
ncbi:MAG: RimK/LysX family protein [Patescibacteria group bacterium]